MAALRVEAVADPAAPAVRRRWTRQEYYRMAEAGVLGPDERVELIDGEVLVVSPQNEPHGISVLKTQDAVEDAFGRGYTVRPQLPLALGLDSDPEPDIAVVAGEPDDYADHPTTALLVVEVSSTTLAFDRGTKASLYARASIPDYWILNLVDRQLEVHRDPGPLPNGSIGYRGRAVLKANETIRPLARPEAEIEVEALLPKPRAS